MKWSLCDSMQLFDLAPLQLEKTRRPEGGKKNDPTPRGVGSSPFLKCICELVRIHLCKGYLKECRRDENPYPFHTHQHRLRWFCLCKSNLKHWRHDKKAILFHCSELRGQKYFCTFQTLKLV